MACAFSFTGRAVVARGNAVAVGGVESSYLPRILDRGLARADAPLELTFFGVAERHGRGFDASRRG